MTLGNLEILYDNLLLDSDKKLISIRFGEPATATFKSYMMAVREVRNACAHGNVLWDLTLCNGILSGIACPTFPPHTQQTFHGALRVIDYLLRQISVNRANDMWTEIHTATKHLYSKSPSIKNLIESKTGIILPNKVSRIKGIANLLKKIIEKLQINKIVVPLSKMKVYLGGPVAPSCTINKTKSSFSCLQLELVFFMS